MVHTVAHLSEAELEAEYVACSDARRSRHLQAIRLLAKGHSVAEVSTITAYGERWIEQLRARYNADGLAGHCCMDRVGGASGGRKEGQRQ